MNEYRETIYRKVKNENGLCYALESLKTIHMSKIGWDIGAAKVTILPSGEIGLEITITHTADNFKSKEVYSKIATNEQEIEKVITLVHQSYKESAGWAVKSPILNKLPSGNVLVQVQLEQDLKEAYMVKSRTLKYK